MPDLNASNLAWALAGVSQATATPDGIELWPSGGTSAEKRLALARVRERKPSLEQVDILRQALASNEDIWIVTDIICTLEWLEGHEVVDDSGRHVTWDGIAAEYETALQSATSVNARIALHVGFAAFHPTGSKDGLIRREDAERLNSKLNASRDPAEQRVLVELLRNRAGYDEARLLDALNAMLDTPSRPIMRDDLQLWEHAVGKVTSTQFWRKDQLLLDASRRVTRHWDRLSDSSALVAALDILSRDCFRVDLWSVFAGHAEHGDAGVRTAAIPGIARFGVQDRDKLISMLRTDPDQNVLDSVWTFLEESGVNQNDLIKWISNHTDSTLSARVVLRKLSRRRGVPAWDPMQALWPGLSPSFRDAVRRVWRHDVDVVERSFHHHFWWELMHDLRHRIGEGVSGIAALSWLTRPFDDVLGSVDFEQVSSTSRL